MIDWKKSAELHNMTISDLKIYFEKFPGSGKEILAICNKCNKIRYIRYYGYRDLCRMCTYNERIILKCDNCGEEISKIESHLYEHNFCNNKCKNEWLSKNSRKEQNPNYKGKIILKCDNCGKEIEKTPSQIRRHNFCDQKCTGEWKSKNLTDKNSHLYKKITVICDNCDKKIKKSPSQIRKHNFCNDKCMGEWKSNDIESKIKISATLQGISYDEWENFAKDQPYCPLFNEKCKESNREKYGRMCFLTGLPESDNITSTGKQRKLSVHHADMDKGQGCNDKRWKLVPICMEWHPKVHNELWEARIIWLLDNVWN